jgi:uroporphyrinogen-III synthase
MNRVVLVTRHPADCARLGDLLRPGGYRVHPFPVLRVEEVDDEKGWKRIAATALHNAWTIVASPRAPQRLVSQARSKNAEHILRLPVAAVGEGTATACREAGLEPELVGPGTGLGLAEALIPKLEPGAPVVFGCGHHRRREMPDALSAAGHPVVPVELYAMRRTPPRELPPLPQRLDAVVLTSPRATRYYLEGVGGLPLPAPHWALGPTTQQEALALGVECRIPPRADLESLAEELCRI